MTLGPLLDTHCHLGIYDDPVAVIGLAAVSEVSVVAVTEDPGEFRRLKTRLGNRTNVQVALGLHPLRAASFTPNDMARFFRLLPQTQWIGEVGLDFSRVGVATKKQQLHVFDTVLTEAQPGRHPLTVHSRGAEKEVIARLADANLPAVLHWYSGPLGPIDQALAAGLYFSVNPAMIRSAKFTGLMRAIPAERVLLETDGPYAKTGTRPARPDDLSQVVTKLATVWQTDPKSAASRIRDNQVALLGTIPLTE